MITRFSTVSGAMKDELSEQNKYVISQYEWMLIDILNLFFRLVSFLAIFSDSCIIQLFYRLLDDCEQGLIVANEKTKELRMEARQTAQCTNKIGILTAFAVYSHI